jgi:hypothetical protein
MVSSTERKRHAKNMRERNARLRVKLRDGVEVPPGWHFIEHGDSGMTPCGCVTHVFMTIDCVSLVWCEQRGRFWLRCGACGASWSRAVLRSRGSTGGLALDASHPEERVARARRQEKKRR